MDMDRETAEEIGIAIFSTLLFIVLVVVVGVLYGNGGDLSSTGGIAMVVAIVVFIATMAGVGYWFAFRDY